MIRTIAVKDFVKLVVAKTGQNVSTGRRLHGSAALHAGMKGWGWVSKKMQAWVDEMDGGTRCVPLSTASSAPHVCYEHTKRGMHITRGMLSPTWAHVAGHKGCVAKKTMPDGTWRGSLPIRRKLIGEDAAGNQFFEIDNPVFGTSLPASTATGSRAWMVHACVPEGHSRIPCAHAAMLKPLPWSNCRPARRRIHRALQPSPRRAGTQIQDEK